MRNNLLLLLNILNSSHIEIKICDVAKNFTYFSGTTWGLFDWLHRVIVGIEKPRYAFIDVMLSKEINCCYIEDNVLIVYLDD